MAGCVGLRKDGKQTEIIGSDYHDKLSLINETDELLTRHIMVSAGGDGVQRAFKRSHAHGPR